MFKLNADPQSTAARVGRLRGYFENHVLADRSFICSTQSECKGSHQGTFYAGQLPHIGSHYDLTRNDTPLRIVVVGQEYGHGPHLVTLEERRKMIVEGSGGLRFKAARGSMARNPHMKGCTSLLRLLFERDLGSGYEGEFLDLDGERTHLFDCFALVNFLLCSAVPTEAVREEIRPRGGRPGQSTRVMQENCARHFLAAMEVLEPTLIVLQGRGVRGWTKAVFGPLSDDVIQTVNINRRSVHLLAFTHPSARGVHNWGSNDRMPYLLDVVAPAVQDILAVMR